jgi:hypothetical protein
MSVRQASLFLAVILQIPALAFAGMLPPPSDYLHVPANNMVAATVRTIDPNGKLTIVKTADVFGANAAPEEITLTVPTWVLRQVAQGESYLFAYTQYRMSPVEPKQVIVNPAGPLLLVGPGLEPALFRDDAAARRMFAHHPLEDRVESREYLDEVLIGLGNTDLQYQNYFAAELALRPHLRALLTKHDIAAIEQVIRNPHAHASARSWLLTGASLQPEMFDAKWLRAICLQLLVELPESGHGAANDFSAALAMNAFVVAAAVEAPLPLPLLSRWIASDSPALAEQALLAIRRTQPNKEKSAAEAVLAHTLLPADTRVFLRGHLRRLELMQTALRTSERVSD